MPWKECHVMDERLRFVARLLEGEKMAPLCAEFGISRKTGRPCGTPVVTPSEGRLALRAWTHISGACWREPSKPTRTLTR